MPETDARRILAALAARGAVDGSDEWRGPSEGTSEEPSGPPEYGRPIDRATAATADLASATAFLADHDLAELEAAVERAEADLSQRGETGRDALETLRDFQHSAIDVTDGTE